VRLAIIKISAVILCIILVLSVYTRWAVDVYIQHEELLKYQLMQYCAEQELEYYIFQTNMDKKDNQLVVLCADIDDNESIINDISEQLVNSELKLYGNYTLELIFVANRDAFLNITETDIDEMCDIGDREPDSEYLHRGIPENGGISKIQSYRLSTSIQAVNQTYEFSYLLCKVTDGTVEEWARANEN
jgi:hypothetical protein